MYRTTPKSAPVTKTFIPVSRVRLGREERERVEVEREGGGWEEEEGGLERDTVRGCLVLYRSRPRREERKPICKPSV